MKCLKLCSYEWINEHLYVSGSAPVAWINSLKQNSALLQPAVSLSTDDQGHDLVADEWLQAVSLQQKLDGISFYFSEGIAFNAAQQILMQQRLDKIGQLLALLDKH